RLPDRGRYAGRGDDVGQLPRSHPRGAAEASRPPVRERVLRGLAQVAGEAVSQPAACPAESAPARAPPGGEFAVTAELVPPLSADPGALVDKAQPLLGVVGALNGTDGAGARPHMASLAAASLLAREGHEPVL